MTNNYTKNIFDALRRKRNALKTDFITQKDKTHTRKHTKPEQKKNLPHTYTRIYAHAYANN